jgi:hypothetical protein
MTRALFWLFSCLAIVSTDAAAWSARTHRWIAARSAELAPGPVGRIALTNRESLLDGATAPDRRGRGHIPPQAHVWHVEAAGGGPHFGEAPRKAAAMIWRLGRESPPAGPELAFELGRLCHIAADLSQPLHTDGGRRRPFEDRYHARYERDVERLLDDFGPVTARPEGPPIDVRSALESLARAAHAGYEPLEHAYLAGDGLASVEELTRARLRESIAATLDLWGSVPPLARAGPPAGTSSKAGMAAAVLLAYFGCAPLRRRARLRASGCAASAGSRAGGSARRCG